METTDSIDNLSTHLFWDTDKSQVSFEDSEAFIIQRVLEYGLIKDWDLINRIYGPQKIKAVSLLLRSIDDVTLSFLCTIYNLEKKDFRCYRLKQSTPNSWNY